MLLKWGSQIPCLCCSPPLPLRDGESRGLGAIFLSPQRSCHSADFPRTLQTFAQPDWTPGRWKIACSFPCRDVIHHVTAPDPLLQRRREREVSKLKKHCSRCDRTYFSCCSFHYWCKFSDKFILFVLCYFGHHLKHLSTTCIDVPLGHPSVGGGSHGGLFKVWECLFPSLRVALPLSRS